MRAELVDGADVEAALHEWENLYAADPLATPFVSPAWARAWLTHWAPDSKPYMLLVRDGRRVAGVLALTIRRRGPLRLLGALGQEPGDYWDVVAAPDDRDRLAPSLVVGSLRLRSRVVLAAAGVVNARREHAAAAATAGGKPTAPHAS